MIRGVSAALVIVGIMLVIWGIRASQSIGSELSETFTGTPSDKVIMLLVGGVAAIVIGLFGLWRGGGRTG